MVEGDDQKKIFAPVVVGTPPSDAYIGLSLMEDGEIRHYNYGEQRESEKPYYLSSRDNGRSWKKISIADDLPYADIRSPFSGEYIRAMHSSNSVYVIRTVGGIDGGRTITKIDNKIAIMLKPPIFTREGRVIIAAHGMDRKGCFTYYSDDDGVSWSKSNTINTPFHKKGGFHKGIRWNHGAVEPTVVELENGRIWMIIRTSQDRHYQSFSEDGGATWSEPTPSPFYGTITMPTLHRLRDGRLLFFWSNTTPLPEMASSNGTWDDVFTNRNATHVAISEDDGKSWIGMRELYLDSRRNAQDFASAPGIDKSVHQAQAVELDNGNVLVSIGQNIQHRKMIVFNPEWIYETERSNDFTDSLEQWSTFKYYKGIVGHCGYNRIQGGNLVAHPDKEGALVLNIRYQPNNELVEDNDGAVWNFPSLRSGSITTRIMIPKEAKRVELILNDRWFNPTDTVARYENQYIVALTREELKIRDNKWHDVTIKWHEDGNAEVFVDGKRRKKLKQNFSAEHGISYLHFLGGKTVDPVGIMIESVKSSPI